MICRSKKNQPCVLVPSSKNLKKISSLLQESLPSLLTSLCERRPIPQIAHRTKKEEEVEIPHCYTLFKHRRRKEAPISEKCLLLLASVKNSLSLYMWICGTYVCDLNTVHSRREEKICVAKLCDTFFVCLSVWNLSSERKDLLRKTEGLLLEFHH